MAPEETYFDPLTARRVDAHWNSTEVYERKNGQWKIVHSHWSYVMGKL